MNLAENNLFIISNAYHEPVNHLHYRINIFHIEGLPVNH